MTTAALRPCPPPPGRHELIGLARLMRSAFEGENLQPVWDGLLARAAADPDDAGALMDLSSILMLTGRRDDGLAVQADAVAKSPLFQTSHGTGEGLRLLAFVTQGDFMANTPLDLLLEQADATLTFLYVDASGDLPDAVPDHDLAFLAIGESSENAAVLEAMKPILARWPRPVVNAAPDRIAALTRDGVCALFTGDEHVFSPPTLRVGRDRLERVVAGALPLGEAAPGLAFPIIARPLDTHAGTGMCKIDDAAGLAAFLGEQADAVFYVFPFIDYSGPDGLFRKQRIAFINGRPFIGHMAVSEHWMVHYLNAGMTQSTAKREEEARFMETFEADFAVRHTKAFGRLHAAFGLEYFAIDCAELPDGRLLLFEADVAMILHDLDPTDLHPYKKPAMKKLMNAFEAALRDFRMAPAVAAA